MAADTQQLLADIDGLKAAFDKAANDASRRSFADVLKARDKTEEFMIYQRAGDDLTAARNFIANGNAPKAAEKLGKLATEFAANAQAYRAREKFLPAPSYSRKTIFAALAAKVQNFKDPEFERHKAEAKARVDVLQEAQRMDTLSKKTAAVQLKIGQG